jgi:hypothetical protein
MSIVRRFLSLLSRRRPARVSDWYFVTFDDQVVRLQARPPGREPWEQEFRWDKIVRVCFMAEKDMWTSDGIYVFTSERPESYAIPSEASGGSEFWAEVLRRRLFDPALAIRAALSDGELLCWPDAATGQPPAANRTSPE